MKQWIEHHKRILQKAAGALLAFIVGACLVFIIHPVKTLPKDRLLSLSRMQEASQQFVAPSSKEPALEDLLSLELARGEGKVQKKLGDFVCIRQKIWKSSELYTRRYEFWSTSPVRLWGFCEGALSLYHRISKAGS